MMDRPFFKFIKRIKDEEEAATEREQKTIHNICCNNKQKDFSDLPILPLENILSYLCVKDILTLRLVNSTYKRIIDNYYKLWRRLQLNLDFDCQTIRNKKFASLNSSSLDHFLDNTPKLEQINLKCKNYVLTDSDVAKINSTRHQRPFLETLKLDYTIRAQLLNIKSIELLNLFAQNSKRLVIESFFEPRPEKCANFRTTQFMSQFPHLTCLNLNLQIDDKFRSKTHLTFWPYVYSINILVNQMDTIFPNLAHLHLSHYHDRGALLLERLSNLTKLKVLELANCKLIPPETQVINIRKKLNIETLIVYMINKAGVKMCLAHANVNNLKNLGLFVNTNDSDQFDFRLLEECQFTNLQTLSTNIFHENINNLQHRSTRDANVDVIMSPRNLYLICNFKSYPPFSEAVNGDVCYSILNGYRENWGHFDVKNLFRLDNFVERGNFGRVLSRRVEMVVIETSGKCDQNGADLEELILGLIGYFKENAKLLKGFQLRLRCLNNCLDCGYKKIQVSKKRLNKLNYHKVKLEIGTNFLFFKL